MNYTTPIITSALFLVVCLASAGVKPVEHDLPPIAYLNFEVDTGLVVRDESGNGHDGIVMADGKRTAWGQGRLGKALEFDADRNTRHENGCVQIPKMGGQDFTKGLTVELWVKFKTVDTTGTRFHLIDNENAAGGFCFFLAWRALYLSAPDASGKLTHLHTNPAQIMFETETWYHLAATFDGSVARIYLDGWEVAASEPGFVIKKGRDEISIGAAPGAATYGLEGSISDVKLYDYARSAVQVMKAARF